ncbi:cytidylate kinase-like family protein [Clostridium sp. AF15-17LB]|nr:cytidylate kinase-like family protein [Clostridium sp. AF15-17LB]
MKLVITMSRRYGTGASIIAQELSKRLGVPVYDKVNVEQELYKNIYESEVEVIKELAEKPCIILGRCASEILKDRKNVFNIYVCADKEDRVRRIMEKDGISYEEADEKVERTDEERATYYHEHTGKAWGDVNNYHMILNTSDLGVDNCADILMRYFEKMEYI